MEERKLTRRQKYTINMLQEAYVDLLQESADGNVSVVELCQRADVNRSTFYYYYTDIEDLKDRTISYIFQQIFEVLHNVKKDNPGDAHQQIRNALNITIKNKKLCRQLLCDSRAELVAKALEDNLSLFWYDILSTGCTDAIAKLSYSYFCGGLARLWIGWIESDCATPIDELAVLIEKIIVHYYTMLENFCN